MLADVHPHALANPDVVTAPPTTVTDGMVAELDAELDITGWWSWYLRNR